ncbi:valacyclovir hydrolase-like [Diaphorina citri]|uniref:Valacyclovir hydrolase-like n=1 Tax=Diaphorina citri TaxID=121845 RepID=A0A3Q0J9N1_DIACI|nr:valacyclovir hydrolase-like [Diaphorina citri]
MYFQEQKVVIDNKTINYLKTGTGPHNVLCLPGALGSIWSDFKPQIEDLSKEKFTLVVWDPPGYGYSRPPERDFSPGYFQRDAEMAFKLMQTDIDLYESIRDLSKWSVAMKSPLIELYTEPGLTKLWGQFCDAFLHILKHQEGNICKDYLGKIEAPTFILHGAKDPMVPSYHPPFLREHIKNTKYFEFKDGKHNIHLKYKTEFNAKVQDFLLS